MEAPSVRATGRRALLAEWSPQTVAILAGLELGDLLCTVPALRALRGALPDARIGLIGLLWARQLIARFPRYLDDFIPLPATDSSFDLVIRMDGPSAPPTGLHTRFGGAMAGYAEPGAPVEVADLFMPYPDSQP